MRHLEAAGSALICRTNTICITSTLSVNRLIIYAHKYLKKKHIYRSYISMWSNKNNRQNIILSKLLICGGFSSLLRTTAEQVSGSLLSFHSGAVELLFSPQWYKVFLKANIARKRVLHVWSHCRRIYEHATAALKLISPARCHQELVKLNT